MASQSTLQLSLRGSVTPQSAPGGGSVSIATAFQAISTAAGNVPIGCAILNGVDYQAWDFTSAAGWSGRVAFEATSQKPRGVLCLLDDITGAGSTAVCNLSFTAFTDTIVANIRVGGVFLYYPGGGLEVEDFIQTLAADCTPADLTVQLRVYFIF